MHTPMYLSLVAALWMAVASAVPFRDAPYLVWNRTAIAGYAKDPQDHDHPSSHPTNHTPPLHMAGRDISTFRGKPNELCSLFAVVTTGERYGWLYSMCSLDGDNYQTNVNSELDLNRCLGNYGNHLDWGVGGGAFASCTGCTTRWMQNDWLDCACGTVNLLDEIYVDADGAVACFDQHGSSSPAPY